MTKQERKVILTGAGIVIAVLLIILIVNAISKKDNNDNTVGNTQTIERNEEKYTTNLADGTKINNSSEFNKVKKYKNLEISNIQFTYKDGKTVLLADVKNTGSTAYKQEIVKMTILGENNTAIDELEPIMPNLEAGETKQLNVIITGADSANAKDFKVEAK